MFLKQYSDTLLEMLPKSDFKLSGQKIIIFYFINYLKYNAISCLIVKL